MRSDNAVKYRIGVVEDEPVTRVLLARTLKPEFDLCFADTGADLCKALGQGLLDVILLDIMLPDEDGISIARTVRARSAIPIILVSGLSSAETMIAGLNVGADDYVTKPFHAEVLRARIRSVLRRARLARTPVDSGCGPLRIGDCGIDIWSRTAVTPDGRLFRFTEKELQILSALLCQPGQPVDRNSLSRLLSGKDWSPTNRGLDVHMSNLRKKLAKMGDGADLIVSFRGVGYALKTAPRAAPEEQHRTGPQAQPDPAATPFLSGVAPPD